MKYVDINSEVWVNIKGVDKEYLVSSEGRVKSLKYNNERIMNQCIVGKGYLSVSIRINGKYKRCYVHRLVALNFIKNIKNKPEVNHKDGDKKNNRKSNLEWVDGLENMKHARDKLGFNMNGENSPNSKLTKKDVIKIIQLYNEGELTSGQIGKMYGVCYKHVWALAKGIYWKHLKTA